MKNTSISNRLIMSLILVCFNQHIGTGIIVQSSKTKNITIENFKQTTRALGIDKTTTTTIDFKPELETTTLSADFELNARHAFINNQYVAEPEEHIEKSSPPSIIRRSQEPPYMNTDESFKDYNHEISQIKKPLYNGHVKAEKLTGIPLMSYDKAKFDDYEEEETSEYISENDYMPENCEDTQESLSDNYDNAGHTVLSDEQENSENFESNIYKEKFLNKPHDASNYEEQLTTNLRDSYENNNYKLKSNINTEVSYDPELETIPQHIYGSIKAGDLYTPSQQSSTHQYGHSTTLEQYGHTNQNFYDKPQTIQNQKPQYNIVKTPLALFSYQTPRTKQQAKTNYNMPGQSFYSETLPNHLNNITETLSMSDRLDSLNTAIMQNFAYGNSNTQKPPSFSIKNKKFKTVSSAIQYVSTPFADLVFKYSIGMAKHSNSKAENSSVDHQANILKVDNDINEETQ